MYIFRLDDAAEHMNLSNWIRIENLFKKHEICPIYGIIPHLEDPVLLKYEPVEDFWGIMKKWRDMGWTPAMHGYTHVFESDCGGINAVNDKSEFAGLEYGRQAEKLLDGYRILHQNGIDCELFFAPAHTFDENTVEALKHNTPIRVISDTIANDVYYENEVFFIPQQSGKCRTLPFRMVTFCYHPNTMTDKEFNELELFINNHVKEIGSYEEIKLVKRKRSFVDNCLRATYFIMKRHCVNKCDVKVLHDWYKVIGKSARKDKTIP